MATIVSNAEKPLNLDVILSMACSNPHDFKAWNDFEQTNRQRRAEGLEPLVYDGWMRYDLQVHCTQIVIVARGTLDGGYEIREYFLEDH
jgi:hypothetical protein